MDYWSSCALIVFILLLEFFDSDLAQTRDYDYDIERVEKIYGDEETVVDVDWKVYRKGKDHFISGTTNITQDLDNTFMRTAYAEYSATGNKYFAKTPFKLPLDPICDFYNTSYRKYLEPNLIGKTDFPIIPPEGLCPIPKGFYYIKEATFRDFPNLPQHLGSGVWKINDKFMRGNKVVGGFFAIIRTYPINLAH